MRQPSLIKTEIEYPVKTRIEKISRYSTLKRLINIDGDEYIETPKKYKIPESTKDIFYSVDKGFENRLDLISNKFYGTPLLYWAIAMMNEIDNPIDIPSGVILRIPATETLYDIGIIKI